MKNLFFFLLLCATISFSACSNDDDDATPAQFITATIDGSDFEATTFRFIGNSDLGGLIIFIAGKDGNGDGIGLNIPADTQVNSTFQVDESDLAITFTDVDDNAFFTVGEVTITNYDASNKRMEGNFSFTATDDSNDTNVREISNGSFKVTYL